MPAADPAPNELSPDHRYIVRFRDGAGRSALLAVGGRILLELGSDLVAAELTPTQREAVLSGGHADVDVDPRRYFLGVPEETPYGIGMVQAGDVVVRPTDAPIKLCVIDSGYARAHEDLPDDVTASADAGTGAFDVDRCGHGTHVAGTIAALRNGVGIVGIAPDKVRLHIVKTFGDDCRWTHSSSLVRALYECVEAGAKVINMSLGGSTPHWFEAMSFEWAYLRGALPIAAAGNRGDENISYPAGYEHVVSVGAVDAQGNRAGFSQRNADVELAAPGVGVLSTVPNGYSAWSGTSMATPHVAGVAALVWSRNPAWTNSQVRSALQTTAFDLWPSGRDSATGFGLVQAARALEALESGCENGDCGSSSGGDSGAGRVDCRAVCGCSAN